ncbi:uncharacterized protein LOC143028340 isoform X2 [Oratosquilla oratoria]|uniref:uncharacterized protein LOC143028340 isoform X2 n=1 Tax=Oratosquilla oratoria TaxID=337810 RepID=UPI003F76675E
MAAKCKNGSKLWVHVIALAAVVAVVAVGVTSQRPISGAVVFPNVGPHQPIAFTPGISDFGTRNTGAARPQTSSRPRCASAGQEYCERDPEYPRAYIRALIGQRSNFLNFLTDPLLRTVLNDPVPAANERPATRFGVLETPACKATETLIYPQRGKTLNKDWVFILNDESIQQAVRVEKCTRENSSCEFGNNLPQSVDATCRQKYIYKKLLVVDKTNDVVPESVLMPSCCVCYINYDGLAI